MLSSRSLRDSIGVELMSCVILWRYLPISGGLRMKLEPEHTTFPGHRVRDNAAKHARVHVSESGQGELPVTGSGSGVNWW
jgi:hypothetical protein